MFTLFPHFNHFRINFRISNEILDTFSLETLLKKISILQVKHVPHEEF